MIGFQEAVQQFDLMTDNSQLSLGVLPSGHLVQYYFGEKIGQLDLSYIVKDIQRASYLADTDGIKDFKLEQLPLAYPVYGNPDLRTPALQLQQPNGSRISDFRYERHEISKKTKIDGLPTTLHPHSETLKIHLFDEIAGTRASLVVSVFPEFDVFTQHVVIENQGNEMIKIRRCLSLNLDFLNDEFEMLSLSGAWGRENHLKRQSLQQGFQGIDSKRGASGHGQNPFIALIAPSTNEDQGAVYGFNLVYSGNFIASAEVDMHQNTRLQLGINPFDFQWQLEPGASFATPEVAFVYANGLNHMSQLFRRFYTDCLIPARFSRKPRPILMNNWEATYFDFDQEKLLALAAEGQKLGIELFVLDDGWFGERNNDDSSLGDWIPNEGKLGGRMEDLITKIRQLGLDFGLWIEPEMVSPHSRLFEANPDWIISVPGRNPQQVRHQYVLDLSQREVQDYLIATLTRLLEEYEITYIKWDMNRNITDAFSNQLPADRQLELNHRYILGLYRILEKITETFPDVLLESCAGGGGRFDPGMLAYSPQIWASDDTDAVARLAIQEGTALLYPQSAISCHVSAVPNHQVGRITDLNTRGIVAQFGNFGYELDLLQLTTVEKARIKEQIRIYKELRETLQFGELSRLPVYQRNNEVAWQVQDETQLVVSHVTILAQANTVPKRLKLRGLKAGATFRSQGDQRLYTGKELMTIGLPLPRATHDFYGSRWILKKCDEVSV